MPGYYLSIFGWFEVHYLLIDGWRELGIQGKCVIAFSPRYITGLPFEIYWGDKSWLWQDDWVRYVESRRNHND